MVKLRQLQMKRRILVCYFLNAVNLKDLFDYTISPTLYKEKSLLLTQLNSGTGLDHSDHQDATLSLRPPGCALSPPSSATSWLQSSPTYSRTMSETSLVVPFFILKTDLICKIWIFLIWTYWCKILPNCLHDALHGAGLDDDDEVNQLEGEEPRFQHLLLDLLDFYLVQSDAMPAPEADSWLCFHIMIMIITCSISAKHVRRPLPPIALTPFRAANS